MASTAARRGGTTPFALGRFVRPGDRAFTGVVVDERVVPLAELLPGMSSLDDLLAAWDTNVTAIAERCEGLALDPFPRSGELGVLAPVEPRQVFQSGANYHRHVVELVVAAARARGEEDLDAVRAQASAAMTERARSGRPYVFTGLPSAVSGPFDDVLLPVEGEQHDWELELAAVIARPAHQVHRGDGLGYVAGYCIVNDLTTRDRVYRPDMPGIGTDWLASKNAPTFLPTGPFVVPAAFVDPGGLRVQLRVNGELFQDESTSDMIFDVARLVEHVSTVATLLPGDLLLTGSPAGNGAELGRFLAPGDVLEGTITGLGTQRNRCRRAGTTP